MPWPSSPPKNLAIQTGVGSGKHANSIAMQNLLWVVLKTAEASTEIQLVRVGSAKLQILDLKDSFFVSSRFYLNIP